MPENPDKYIRAAYVTLLNGLNVPVYSNRVPKDRSVKKYVLLSSQTKVEGNYYKNDGSELPQYLPHDWLSYITISIFNHNDIGYSNQAVVDDIADAIQIRLRNNGIYLADFTVQETRIESSSYQSIDSKTESVDVINIIIRHTLCYQ